MRYNFVLGFAIIFATSAFAQPKWELSPSAFGKIKVGMSMQDIAKLSNDSLKNTVPDTSIGENEGCFMSELKGKDWDGVSFMMSDDKVVRFDLFNSNFLTSRGIKVGDSEEQVLKAYPNIVVTPHHYNSKGHYLTYRMKPNYAIRFETDEGRVTLIYAGRYQEVQYVEGCL